MEERRRRGEKEKKMRGENIKREIREEEEED